MQKNKNLFFYCIAMCSVTLVLSLGLVWWSMYNSKKIAVVDAIKLFDSYNMKKELETNAKAKLIATSKKLDSIGNALRMAQGAGNADMEKALTFSYNNIKTALNDEYTKSNHDINEQVWKRLNPLMDEYGKKKGLHLIIGANGMGSVLYNDEYYDLTNEAIKFVNKKYEEGI